MQFRLLLLVLIQTATVYSSNEGNELYYYTWRVLYSDVLPVGLALGSSWTLHPSSTCYDSECKFTRGQAVGPSGEVIAVVGMYDNYLEEFLLRFSSPPVPWSRRSGNRCESGRYLLHDPRIGFFHNQRLSYELARQIAQKLGRTLVLPGFFKFPHPEASDGVQWVPVKRLFDWEALENCTEDIVEIGELISECGSKILNDHVTVPFRLNWVAEGRSAPWANGTLPHLRWRAARAKEVFRFRSRWTFPGTIDNVPTASLSYFLRYFLHEIVAPARTVRSHGLFTAQVSLHERNFESPSLCFVPEATIRQEAQRVVGGFEVPVLGVHMRFWDNYDNGPPASGKGHALSKDMEDACTIDITRFVFMILMILINLERAGLGRTPSSSIIASNTENFARMATALIDLPKPRLLSSYYSLETYVDAVSIDDCEKALRSILFDAMALAYAHYFFGNQCSSMSQFVILLRQYFIKQPLHSHHLLGGSQASSGLGRRVAEMADEWERFGRPDLTN